MTEPVVIAGDIVEAVEAVRDTEGERVAAGRAGEAEGAGNGRGESTVGVGKLGELYRRGGPVYSSGRAP